eukprot:CAMPEP_0183382014 /NCGR_PEP_ID=MMETSP0164_2-20130417/126726_1 /TAXON_ID=221442 /ORGANISM="Coccolithus pelagicus ssp braarudi, Strain PLY182g" /LENGTH=75 /DNA_ID=CAMNT_0025559625 /DNA_START=853 /DNA_END=1077 /DNA_ORIENTATION=+
MVGCVVLRRSDAAREHSTQVSAAAAPARHWPDHQRRWNRWLFSTSAFSGLSLGHVEMRVSTMACAATPHVSKRNE